MTGKVIHVRFAPYVTSPNQARRHPAMLAAHVEQWRQGVARGKADAPRLILARTYGRHSVEAVTGLAAGPGRLDQPDGRHTPEYRATVTPTRGMYPLGGARRVTGDNDTGMDDDRGHSDANQRYRLDADGKVTR